MKASGLFWEIIAVWLLAAAAFVFPLLAVMAPLGITVEFVILGIGVLPFVIVTRAWRRLPHSAPVLLAMLVIWAGASMLWAEDPYQAGIAALRLTGVFLLGLSNLAATQALPATSLRPVRIALLAGIGLVAITLLLNELAGHLFADLVHLPAGLAISHPVKRGIAVLALLVWPARMALRRQVPAAVLTLLTGSILAVVVLGQGSTSKIATGLGLAVTLLVAITPRRAATMVGAVLILVTLGMPMAAYFLPSPQHTFQHWTFLPNSAHHRMTIWGFTAQRIAERPLLGWGMNASRGFPGGDDEVVLHRYNAEGQEIEESTEPVLPLHPHNALLQLWLELGAVGILVFCAFVAWVLSCVGRVSVAQRGDLASLVMTIFVMAASSFGFWQGWWQSSLWLTATFALLAMRSDGSYSGPSDRDTAQAPTMTKVTARAPEHGS